MALLHECYKSGGGIYSENYHHTHARSFMYDGSKGKLIEIMGNDKKVEIQAEGLAYCPFCGRLLDSKHRRR